MTQKTSLNIGACIVGISLHLRPTYCERYTDVSSPISAHEYLIKYLADADRTRTEAGVEGGRGFKCNICPTVRKTRGWLANHMRREHKDALPD